MKRGILAIMGGLAFSGMGLAGSFDPAIPDGDFRVTPMQEQEFFQPMSTPAKPHTLREQPTPAGDPKRSPSFSTRTKQPTKTIFLPPVE